MMQTLRQKVIDYAKETYHTTPDKPWPRFPENEVLRHDDNRKWYGLLMTVDYEKLGVKGDGSVDVLNVKCDPIIGFSLRAMDGILPAYHMNHTEWISILLDGTVPIEEIFPLLDMSYSMTASKKKKEKIRGPKEWILPANPKYYDVEHAFDHTDEIEWKQSNNIKVGDTIYLYVTAPVSAILFRCKAIKVDIPCNYESEDLTIRKLVRVKLEKRYRPDEFPFSVLKEYGVNAIRGPRSVPHSLSEELKR